MYMNIYELPEVSMQYCKHILFSTYNIWQKLIFQQVGIDLLSAFLNLSIYKHIHA